VSKNFPPLEKITKGGYDREFKKYTVENLINIVSKRVNERPETESPDCPAFLMEQNLVLEQSKKLPKSKDPFFLTSQGRKNGNKRRKGKKGNGKNSQKKQTTADVTVSTETRYADVVKETSPVEQISEETVTEPLAEKKE